MSPEARDEDAPADTTMMRIVHDALRRDLSRSRAVLTRNPPPDDRQRAAIAEQVAWVMSFLEAHHRLEDDGLYPFVRERDPGTASLLDEMGADHQRIAAAISTVERAASRYAGSAAPEPLVRSLDELSAVLLPHLQREEDVAMPMVSRAITDAQWRAIEDEFIEEKSMAQLGREGHWLIDGTTPEDRAHVLGLVSPVQRFVLLHGFGRSYRRRTRVWQGIRRRVQHQGSTAVVTAAEIDAVWEIVRDPTRVGEWSHECVGGEWVGEVTDARPGARFRGRNAQGRIQWGRVCEVVSAEPYEIVWRTVPTRLYPDSTRWTLRLTPRDGGTHIEQSFEVVKGTVLEPLYVMMLPAHRDRTDALTEDLHRIGELALDASPRPAVART